MKRALAVIMSKSLPSVVTASSMSAAGDSGQGDVNQVQVMDRPAFHPQKLLSRARTIWPRD